MITVSLNEPNFEYDIHSLVKAFFPKHDVLVKAEPLESFPESIFHLTVNYEPASITFSFFKGSEAPEEDVCPGGVFRASLAEHPGKLLLFGETPADHTDRKTTKNQLKQRLYALLADFSGQTLPWGTLTGIRPVKIPLGMMEQGASDAEIRSYMKETYLASDEKITLSLDVAKRERELLSRLDYENGYSLYVGIPFCPSTCLYCSFTSYPIHSWKGRVDAYLDALEREMTYVSEAMKDKVLNSVYIGGGTPTSLEPVQLERLIGMIGRLFRLYDEQEQIRYEPNRLLEFTVEAGRPDSITPQKLEVLLRHGVSRISINPQTMKDATLRLIGRNHTVAQTKESFRLAREMGFDNINMDLIVGLPEETIDDVRRTMEELAILGPDNVTVHSLAVKRAARLRMQQEDYSHLHMENTWDIIHLTADYCARMGLEPYYLYRQKNMAGNFENVGYAAPGKAGVYNILIMEEKQTIMALGAGATSKVVFAGGERIERAGNVKDIAQYMERIDEMIGRKKNLLALTQKNSLNI